MLDWFLNLVNSMFGLVLDYVIYAIVDVVYTRKKIQNARNEKEERTVWRRMCFMLTCLSGLTWLTHHRPYLLAFLTACTFLFTQTSGGVVGRKLVQRLQRLFTSFVSRMALFAQSLSTHRLNSQSSTSANIQRNCPPSQMFNYSAAAAAGNDNRSPLTRRSIKDYYYVNNGKIQTQTPDNSSHVSNNETFGSPIFNSTRYTSMILPSGQPFAI